MQIIRCSHKCDFAGHSLPEECSLERYPEFSSAMSEFGRDKTAALGSPSKDYNDAVSGGGRVCMHCISSIVYCHYELDVLTDFTFFDIASKI